MEVTISHGGFKDFFGNQFGGLWPGSYTFKIRGSGSRWVSNGTSSTQWTTKRIAFKEGAVFHESQGELFLYGGLKDGLCESTAYKSKDGGAVWQIVDPFTSIPGEIARSPSAVDRFGCIWMIGGQCNNQGTSTIWRTCTMGLTWDQLPFPYSMPLPGRLAFGDPWPKNLEGHLFRRI